jgi:hypothetical protein
VELSEEELREYAEKIKTLVEVDQKEMAIDLVCSLNAPKLLTELLHGCSMSSAWICRINFMDRGCHSMLHVFSANPLHAWQQVLQWLSKR